MKQVNMHEAKTNLSRLIAEIESRDQDQIVIARNGRPVAVIKGIKTTDRETASHRVGAARGSLEIPDDIDTPFGDLSPLFGQAEMSRDSES